MVFATTLAEPAPPAGTPPSASRFARMLSGDAPTTGAATQKRDGSWVVPTQLGNLKHFCAPTSCKPKPHEHRHEWVCGLTTLERSDRRKLAHPEMAASEGEFEPPKQCSLGM